VGSQYLHDANEQKGELSATYKFAVKEPGKYDVRIAYTANPNRATNVPITIAADGKPAVSKTLNQRQTPAIDKRFQSLGQLEVVKEAIVVISNKDTDGHVIVDAVQLLPVK
jgi:hypothetical protein